MNRLNHALHIKDAPIALGVVLAALAWVTNNLVTRLEAAPIIVYEQEWLSSDRFRSEYHESTFINCQTRGQLSDETGPVLTIRLHNLSNTVLLENIGISVGVPAGADSEILGIRLRVKSPASRGDALDVCGASFFRLDALVFHPGWEYLLLIRSTKKFSPSINLISSDHALSLVPVSFTTYLVEYQGIALIVALVLLSGLAVWYLYILASPQDAKEDEK